MNVTRQAAHVAAKDLRQSSWLLMGFTAFLLFGLVGALQLDALRDKFSLVLAAPALIGVMIFITVGCIHHDSPVDATADWTARPLNGLTVGLAKLLVPLLLLVIAMVGQIGALLINGVSGTGLLDSLWSTGATALTWLALALTLGSVTRSQRGFVMAALILLLAFALVLLISTITRASFASTTTTGLGVAPAQGSLHDLLAPLGIASAVGTMLLLYRFRDLRRWSIVPVAATSWLLLSAVTAGVTSSWFASTQPDAAITPVPLDDLTEPAAVRVDSLGITDAGIRTNVTIRHAMSDTSEYRYATRNVVLMYVATGQLPRVLPEAEYMRSLTSFPVGLANNDAQASMKRAPVPSGMTSLNAPALPSPWFARTVMLTADEWRAIRAGSARIDIEATGEALAASELARIAVGNTGLSRIRTWGVRLGKVKTDSGRLRVELSVSTLASDATPWAVGEDEPVYRSYALVNATAGQVLDLAQRFRHFSSEMLVLPGGNFGRVTTGLVPLNRKLPASDSAATARWLQGAHLVITEWKPVRRFPLKLTSATAK